MTKGKTQATGTGIGPGVGATKEQSIGGSGKELFVLKYLRFACCNLTRTKEFYISLGMSVEWQVKSNKQSADKDKKEGAAGAPDTPGDALGQDGKGLTAVSENPSESDATKSAKDGASNPAAAAVDDNANSIQSKTDLCLSFVNIPSTEHEVHAESHQFQLIFETGQKETEEGGQDEAAAPNKPNISRKLAAKKAEEAEEKKDRNLEYLVVYVHFLPRIVKRLASKGFHTLLPITTFQNAQIAIYMDPNAIEVRLIELTESQLEDPKTTTKRQWFARVGYYTLPSVTMEATARYWERMFSYVPQAQNAAGKKGEGHKGKGRKGAQMEPAVGAALAGIRLVDSEEYVVGLTKTQFMWLGNEPRSLGVSICFTGKVLAESQEIRPVDRSQSKLLALGIEVPNLDGLIRRWEWERPNEGTWSNSHSRRRPIRPF